MPYNGGRAFDFFSKQLSRRPATSDPTYGLKVIQCKPAPIFLITSSPTLTVTFTPESGSEALLLEEFWELTPVVFTPAHSPSVEPWEVPPAGTTFEHIEPWENPPDPASDFEHLEPWEFPPPLVFTSEHTEAWES